MKYKKLFIIAAIAIVAFTTLAFSGCHRYRSPEERMTHKFDHISSHLELTEPQKMALGEVKGELLRARKALKQDHQVIFDELLTEIKGERMDQTKVVGLIEQHQAQLVKVAPPVVAKVAEFHASLTPEQKDKAVERLEWLRDKMTRHSHDAKM